MSSVPASHPNEPEPAWDIARLYSPQGQWSDGEYLRLTEGTNRLVELTDGHIEVLAMPTSSHQRILLFLFAHLQSFVTSKELGEVLFASLRVRIRKGKFREPDIVFMLAEHHGRAGEEYWEGADLVMEVVSKDPESRRRDLEDKPLDYAEAGIPEYWIVDPIEKQITVLTLNGQRYADHGKFLPGQQASSHLLDGFVVDVESVFQAAKG
jgi:Uma2 family endonuclease